MHSYSDLKKLLQETLEAPHAVYVPTKLSLSSGVASHAWLSTSPAGPATRVTYGTSPGSLGFRAGPADDFTAQELFFLALEREVARINEFALVRGWLSVVWPSSDPISSHIPCCSALLSSMLHSITP